MDSIQYHSKYRPKVSGNDCGLIINVKMFELLSCGYGSIIVEIVSVERIADSSTVPE